MRYDRETFGSQCSSMVQIRYQMRLGHRQTYCPQSYHKCVDCCFVNWHAQSSVPDLCFAPALRRCITFRRPLCNSWICSMSWHCVSFSVRDTRSPPVSCAFNLNISPKLTVYPVGRCPAAQPLWRDLYQRELLDKSSPGPTNFQTNSSRHHFSFYSPTNASPYRDITNDVY